VMREEVENVGSAERSSEVVNRQVMCVTRKLLNTFNAFFIYLFMRMPF
jgi:hypothetical protein